MMKVLSAIPDKQQLQNPVVTIGNFDGVHVGHQEILRRLAGMARERSGMSMVLTFSSHPRRLINPDISLKHIASFDEKRELMEGFGVDYLIVLDFARDIAGLDARVFYDDYLADRIGAQEIVIGYDHAFGKNREGDAAFLMGLSKTSGIGVTRVDEVLLDGRPVSSTWVRDEISGGNFRTVTRLLGRRYGIRGRVVQGARRGSGLGFPTANIAPLDDEKLIPGDGVYAVTVTMEGGVKKGGMANIGNNPTFSQAARTIEVNIFDFSGDIYGTVLEVQFHDRIRDEIRFPSPQDLARQLETDRIAAEKIIHE